MIRRSTFVYYGSGNPRPGIRSSVRRQQVVDDIFARNPDTGLPVVYQMTPHDNGTMTASRNDPSDQQVAVPSAS